MRASSIFLAFATLFVTLAAAASVAVYSADFIESRSEQAAALALQQTGHKWVVVDVDGLLVRLTGIADSEAMRFSALSAAGSAVDANRIIDRMEVVEPEPPAPSFAVEIFRNGDQVSIIGLVPTALDAKHVIGLLARDGAEVTDLLEAADFPIPAGFESATDFAARAALRLARSKISITPQRVSVSAAVESPEQKTRLQDELSRLASENFVLALELTAPRPVVTPFALRFVRDAEVGEFDVCTADTEEARDTIRKAAVKAGLTGQSECIVGLGTPSPKWSVAVEAAIDALKQIGSGSLTFTDADLTLVAAADTDQAVFDRVVGELQTALPPVFSLHSVLTPKPETPSSGAEATIPEFLATLSPEGLVQLRGRVANDLMRSAVEGFAHARFGAENVYTATRPDPNLPNGWPVRVLAALDALALLNNGSVVVQPDLVSIRGATGDAGTRSEIAQILGDKLGEAQDFSLDIKYVELLDPLAGLPTDQECIERIQAVQENAKISFEPGKATIDEESQQIIDALVVAWENCEDVPIEISGHTDSQGRESMNQTLSQTRAEAVVDALLARRVLTKSLIAKGYGETSPIADNKTEEGREANRRIEFQLIDNAALVAARRAELASDTGEDEDEQN